MAGRIRSLKPELLDLEAAAALSSDAWRVWISMMLLADDAGNLRAAPKLLAAHIFHDTARVETIESALEELTAMPEPCRVVLYRCGAELFAHLNGFADGGCKPIAQYFSKLGTGRVPKPTDDAAESVSTIPRTSDRSRKKSEPSASNRKRSVPTTSGRSRAVQKFPRARVPDPDPDQRSRPQDVDPASPSFAHAPDVDDTGGGGTDSSKTDPPTTARSVPSPPPTAPAAEPGAPVLPVSDLGTAIGSSSPPTPPLKRRPETPPGLLPPPGTPVRRPRYEAQRHDGAPLIDPETGRQLVLDLAELSAEQVAAERTRCLAALRPELPVPAAPPPAPVAPPALAPSPLHDRSPESVMREALAAAPSPVPLLAERSASRLGALLVGGQLRHTDIAPALAQAAAKLEPRLARLTPTSSEPELEDLHRVVAGFLAAAPARRRSMTGAPAAPTEAGERFLDRYGGDYQRKFARQYAAAQDDTAHASDIVAELGRRLAAEQAKNPELDAARARRRLVTRLIEQWFGDRFGEQCGHALKQLARLLREEPNRFRLGDEPAMRGASGMAADLADAPSPPPLSPDQIAELNRNLAAIGTGPAPAASETKPCLVT